MHRTTPLLHPRQMKRGTTAGCYKIEVLMSNRVSPVNQFLKQFAPALVSRVQGVDFPPKINAQSVEIGTDRTGVRIAFGEAAIPNKLDARKYSELSWDHAKDMVDAFGMKVPTKSLEVRRQDRGIGIIDLLRRVTPASFGAANRGMRVFDLVERLRPHGVPLG